jgi:cytochrome c peroxidase
LFKSLLLALATFPRPVIPVDNSMSAVKVKLGRYLFYDNRMSVNGQQSCATCHQQQFAFTDGRAQAQGATGQLHPRGSMSLVNVAYVPFLTWANPSITSLEQQALIPMLGEAPIELGLKGHEQEFLETVRRDRIYQTLFPQAFPGLVDPYTIPNVTKAIAAFERTIISMRSPYDRYRWEGNQSAISDAAKRGEILFFSSERARCFQCHAGWNFSGPIQFEGGEKPAPSFFNTGVSQDIGKFRAPSLRNIAVTAPYMHDGSLATLEAVIDHYAAGGKFDHPNKSHILRRLTLTDSDKRDLIEFLKSLTDEEALHDPRWSNPWTGASQ